MNGVNTNRVIRPKLVITIFNILRDIGLNINHRGAKYLNKAIQILLASDSDIVIVKNIYITVASIYGNTTPKQVENDISYAINSRNEEKSIKNFEKVFGFEYDQYLFTNKNFIEEISRIIKTENSK